MTELTQEELKRVLAYNPDSGIFTWLVNRGRRKMIGLTAGSVMKNGYIRICINGKGYLGHRLAFMYMEGKMPPDMVDHKNRNRSDNRWCNLQHADIWINSLNRSDSTLFTGVMESKVGKVWVAQTSKSIKLRNKRITLGYYNTHICACYSRWAYDKGVHYKCESLRKPEGE